MKDQPEARPIDQGQPEAERRTALLTIAYDGTGLVGWQRQPSGVSVQGAVEDALAPIEGRRVAVAGAGRTDAGVHAIAQRASCEIAHPMPPEVLCRALNARLPPQIRVTGADWRPPGFHARFDARAKTYRYAIDTGPVADPFAARFAWHVPAALDVAAMGDALAAILGRHDFAAFRSTGSDVESSVRTMFDASCTVAPAAAPFAGLPVLSGAPRVCVTVTGDGFLRHMVRALVGTLVEVGRGDRPAGDLARLLREGDRSQAGPTAPAHGLCLADVTY